MPARRKAARRPRWRMSPGRWASAPRSSSPAGRSRTPARSRPRASGRRSCRSRPAISPWCRAAPGTTAGTPARTLIPFGADIPGAVEAIAAAARLTGARAGRGLVRRRLRRPGARSGAGLAESPAPCRPDRTGACTEGRGGGDNPRPSPEVRRKGRAGRALPGRSALRREGLGNLHRQARAGAGAVLERGPPAPALNGRIRPRRRISSSYDHHVVRPADQAGPVQIRGGTGTSKALGGPDSPGLRGSAAAPYFSCRSPLPVRNARFSVGRRQSIRLMPGSRPSLYPANRGRRGRALEFGLQPGSKPGSIRARP